MQDVLFVDLGDYFPLNGRFRLFNAAGREVFSERMLYGQARFDLSGLPEGVYHYGFWDGGRRQGSGTVVVAGKR